MRLETRRQGQYDDLHPTRDQLQPTTTTRPSIRPHPSRPKIHPYHQQLFHQTPTHPIPSKGGRCVEPMVEDNITGAVPRHTASPSPRGLQRRSYWLPPQRPTTSPTDTDLTTVLNQGTPNITHPSDHCPSCCPGRIFHYLSPQEGHLFLAHKLYILRQRSSGLRDASHPIRPHQNMPQHLHNEQRTNQTKDLLHQHHNPY